MQFDWKRLGSLWLRLFVLVFGLAYVTASCSQKSSAPTTTNNSGSDAGDDDDDDDDDCSGEGDEEASLKLADSPTWDGEVKSEFSSCIGCHAEGNEPNEDNEEYDCSSPDSSLNPVAIDLSSISLIKKHADEIVDRLKANDDCQMPPGGSGIELELFEDWADNNFAEGANSNDDEEDEDSKSGSDCGSSSDNDEPDEPVDPGVFEPFLNPAELKACNDTGKMYDREKRECTNYTLAEDCDEAWLGSNYPEGWQEIVTTHKSAGMNLDQCGYNESEFLATMVCFAKEKGGDCVDQSELTEDSAVTKIENIRVDR